MFGKGAVFDKVFNGCKTIFFVNNVSAFVCQWNLTFDRVMNKKQAAMKTPWRVA